MAQAALRADAEIDTGLIRRLMARPLRATPDPGVAPRPSEPMVPAAPAADVNRLRAEVMVMKAVLGAERKEAERLRACLGRVEDPAPLSPEAQAVRDRWAALVDQLLNGPR